MTTESNMSEDDKYQGQRYTLIAHLEQVIQDLLIQNPVKKEKKGKPKRTKKRRTNIRSNCK